MTAAPDWYQTFFSGLFVDCWLQATTAEQTLAEADFLQKMLQVSPAARLLDVPCGGGRHALALAERGFAITGVDLSPTFLGSARGGTAGRPLNIHWEQRDMRDLPWANEFDGAFSFGNSFGYLDDAGNAHFLQAVARTLKPGARFVLDTGYITEMLLPNLQERQWYPVGDLLFLADRRYDHVHGRLEVEYTLIRDGKADKRAMSARLYTYREVCGLVREAGFGDWQAFSSLTGEPFQLGSRRLLLVAKK
jgi:SAM-dependent methyltransferase